MVVLTNFDKLYDVTKVQLETLSNRFSHWYKKYITCHSQIQCLIKPHIALYALSTFNILDAIVWYSTIRNLCSSTHK